MQQEARERAERAQREARERAERAQRERARERARQEERERDRAYQRELLSLVCSLVKGPSGSGLLEAARQEIACSGEVGARVDRLLQPTVGTTLTSAPSSNSSGARVLDEHNMAARQALSPISAHYGGAGVASYRAGGNLAHNGGRALRAGAHCQLRHGDGRVALSVG